MRVALDATPLTVAAGGIRRYTEQLHRALAAEFPEDHYELLAPEPGRWWSRGLPAALRRGGFDVFHGTDFAVPYVPVCGSVMTVHDLSPWKDAPWRAASSRVRRRTPWLLRLGLARIVVTPTEAIRGEVAGHFKFPPDRVVAVPLAADPAITNTGEPRSNYILMVGTIEPRKNAGLAIAAWRELRRRGADVELKLVGRNAAGLGAEPGLSLEGAVPDSALPGLYSRALALLMPSHYEGFGLPVVEAFQCATPVIASRDPALMEVAGGAAIHPGSPAEWAEAMASMLRPNDWGARGLERSRAFTWRATARRMREVYESARLPAGLSHFFGLGALG